MDRAVNFYELKQEFADLGFHDAGLVNELRTAITGGELEHHFYTELPAGAEQAQFSLACQREQDGRFSLYCIECSMDIPGRTGSQWFHYFKPDVPAAPAIELVRLLGVNPGDDDPFKPLSLKETQAQINSLNTTKMNEQNLDYLKDNLKYLGFEEKLNGPLAERINTQAAGFNLETTVPHFNDQEMQYSLQFKKSDQTDRYFFNRYEALLTNGKPEEDKVQTFYINKGHGVTAKEAFNLLDGRAVYKTLENKEQQKYNVWMQLDFDHKDERNNYKVNTFHDKYNYKLERVLDKYNIVELSDPEKKAALMKSMQKGNTQQVTAVVDGKEVKAFVAASPEKRSINIYNEKMKPQEQAVYLKVPVKKDLAQEKAEREAQKQAEGQTQGRKKSRGVHH